MFYSCSGSLVAGVAKYFLATCAFFCLTCSNASSQQYDIRLNEILADPTPSKGLPESEYIEIQNTASVSVHLSGWTLSDARSTVAMPDVEALAEEYLVLCPESKSHLFPENVKVVALADWPALNNDEDCIIIKNSEGITVDSLCYSLSLFGKGYGGGISLERSNPAKACHKEILWQASVAEKGGTPGFANSVYKGSESFPTARLIGHKLRSDHLTLEFDQRISLRPGWEVSVNGEPAEAVSNEKSLILTLRQVPASGERLLVKFSNLFDCLDRPFSGEAEIIHDTEAPRVVGVACLSLDRFNVYVNESADLSQVSFRIEDGPETQIRDSQGKKIGIGLAESLKPDSEYSLQINGLKDLQGNEMSDTLIVFNTFDSKKTARIVDENSVEIIWGKPVTGFYAESFRILPDNVPAQVFPLDEKRTRLFFPDRFKANKKYRLAVFPFQNKNGELVQALEQEIVWDTRAPKLLSADIPAPDTVVLYFEENLSAESAERPEHYRILESDFSFIPKLLPDEKSVKLGLSGKLKEEKVYALSVNGVADVFGNETDSEIEIVYDNRPPKIASATFISSDSLLLRYHEDLLDSEIGDYRFVEGPGLKEVVVNPYAPKKRLLVASSSFPEKVFVLESRSLQDLNGNIQSETKYYRLDFRKTSASCIWVESDSSIRIRYSRALENALAKSDIDAEHNVRTVEKVDEQEFRIILSEKLKEGLLVNIKVGSLADINGNKSSRIDTLAVFETGVEGLALSGSRFIDIDFQEPIIKPKPSGFSANGQEATAVHVSENRLTIGFDKEFVSDTIRLRLPVTKAASGEYLPSSVHRIIRDSQAPELIGVEAKEPGLVSVLFNEPVPESKNDSPDRFRLLGVEIDSVDFLGEEVQLYSSSLVDGLEYELSLKKISDESGNIARDSNAKFTYRIPYQPQSGDLVFSEIMASSPSIGPLTGLRYVEVKNLTEHPVFLIGWRFSDKSKSSIIPDAFIEPHGLLLLASVSHSDRLLGHGNAVGLKSFPTPNISGDELRLSNAEGTVIDRLVYQEKWMKGFSGRSLERSADYWPCSEAKNWNPSQAGAGGTPGKNNSPGTQRPDNTKPKALTAHAINDTAYITFDEEVFLDENTSWILGPEITVREFSRSEATPEIWKLIAEAPFETSTEYTLTFKNLKDCAGNTISEAHNTVRFGSLEKARFGDLVINEILSDPKSGGKDFVEIQNLSDSYLNLAEIAVLKDSTDFSGIEFDPLIEYSAPIGPGEIVAFSEDPVIVKNHYPKSAEARIILSKKLPNFDADKGDVFLVNILERKVIDHAKYGPEIRKAPLRDFKGVSYEKIRAERSGTDPENWFTASASAGYATPGLPNSQTRRNENTANRFEISPRALDPQPDGHDDFLSLRFSPEKSAWNVSITIFSSNGQPVRRIAENYSAGMENEWQWAGEGDSNNRLTPGPYIVYIEATNPDGDSFREKQTVYVLP
ncbi:hypothetical protein FUAX_06390 [Fulvitalea axinellae]|uniref:Lamin Tail Domain n=1 Tax=Fulvitalea axinellae TaxID=1182444 RepID=A0AAU9CMV9_9BACT|nr:hypothetical protein FUAX_06390 [Fulvitalea axinellae]